MGVRASPPRLIITIIKVVSKIANEYTRCGDYYIGKTTKGTEFLFDADDYDAVTQYYWKKNNGSIYTICDGTKISIVQFLTGGQNVRHKNGNAFDNRRENLIDCRGYSKRITYNGYYAIYMPEHPKAYSNGCVYEHILVAEEMLGRYLVGEECVHHKDRNRKNNSPDNLMVFKTGLDHNAYHNGAEAVLLEDGTYICPNKNFKWSKKSCPICGKPMTALAKMCLECSNIAKENLRKVNRPSKEDLNNMIRSMPFTKIAEKYGDTDNTVRQWCKSYGLPYRRKDIRAENN